MKKQLLSFASILVVAVFIGAGCNAPSQADIQNQDVDSDSQTGPTSQTEENEVMEDKDTEDETMKKATSFSLTGEAIGDRTIKFMWQVPDDVAEGVEAYRFARGTEPNPGFPSGWWWERGPSHRELEWKGLPIGPAHFRVCVVKNDVCEMYSNNVEVDVLE